MVLCPGEFLLHMKSTSRWWWWWSILWFDKWSLRFLSSTTHSASLCHVSVSLSVHSKSPLQQGKSCPKHMLENAQFWISLICVIDGRSISECRGKNNYFIFMRYSVFNANFQRARDRSERRNIQFYLENELAKHPF